MRIVLVDGNNISFAAQNGPLLTYDGNQVQAIYQSLKMIKSIREHHESDVLPMILWDSRAQWRLDILPEYKGKRDENPDIVAMKEEVKRQKPILLEMLTHLGLHSITVPGYEADDMAGVFTRAAVKSGKEVVLVSGDKDWLQLVQPGVKWLDVIRVRSCTSKDFEEFTEVENGRQWLEVKALMGDKSDCIPGIPGIGDKTATRLVKHWGSVDAFLKACRKEGSMIPKDDLPKDLQRAYKKLDAFQGDTALQAIYERNVKLMNLIDAVSPNPDVMQSSVVRGQYDLNKFREKCEELAFHSIIEELNTWHKLFYVEKKA